MMARLLRTPTILLNAAVVVSFLVSGTLISANNADIRQVETMQIYQYDDYDDCRRAYPDFKYCIVKLHLLPNASSALWHQIQSHSSNPRHFDRRIIEVGACIQECDKSFHGATDVVATTLNACWPWKIWSQYRLNSTVEEVSCNFAQARNKDTSLIFAAAQVAFICWTAGAVLLAIWATAADARRNSRASDKSTTRVSNIVNSFSLLRSLPGLISAENRTVSNLSHLDGFRALTMMIILLTHSSIPLLRMPLKNVNQLERQFEQSWFPIAMASNTYTVQLFFVIGGLLLAVNVLNQTKGRASIDMSYFVERVKHRLIRILPTYLYVILFHITIYPRLYDGSIGERFKDHCAKNWWTNVLFVNNYVQPSEPCIQFAWYLGADFQLYLLGTSIMMFIHNFPKLATLIKLGMVLSAFFIPSVIIYVYHLDATVMMILRYILQEIRTLPYYLRVYIPFETNAGNYFFGMLAGIWYYELKDNPAAADILKLKFVLPVSAAYFVVVNGLTTLLPVDHLSRASIGLAVFGSLLKSAWGIFPSVVLLYLAFHKTPTLLSSLLRHPILFVLAKLSYAVYLTQYAIIYAVYKHITYRLSYDGFTILLLTAAIVTLTFVVAFLLHIFIEIPFCTMFHRMTHTSSTKTR